MSLEHSIDAVLFDLDGTLVDSAVDIANALNQTLLALKHHAFPVKQIQQWIGNGSLKLVERALLASSITYSNEKLAHIHSLFIEKYAINLNSGACLYDGVLETLAELNRRDIKMAIITNKPIRFVPALLEHFAIADYFDTIIGGDSLAKKKPDPEPLFVACDRLGIETHHALMVGDSKNDILAAQAANMRVVGLTYGYNYGEDIALSQPNFVRTNFIDLLDIVFNQQLRERND